MHRELLVDRNDTLSVEEHADFCVAPSLPVPASPRQTLSSQLQPLSPRNLLCASTHFSKAFQIITTISSSRWTPDYLRLEGLKNMKRFEDPQSSSSTSIPV
jgi:hypothetical protein